VSTDYEPGIVPIDPARARGAFVAGCKEALVDTITDQGVADGTFIEVIDVLAALAEIVKQQTAAGDTVADLLLGRLARATLDLLSTAFMRTPEDGELVASWRAAWAEWLAN
jgi:hypothetical protein